VKHLINSLESLIENPAKGLAEDVFLFVSRITPLVNVDLLIKHERGMTLLTWREDGLHPPCWHIPGGIIRFKEAISDRIRAVARAELGTEVAFLKAPRAFNEYIHPSRNVRGHFISLLFDCTLISPPDPNLMFEKGTPKPGQWAWHQKCPDNLITGQEMYREVF